MENKEPRFLEAQPFRLFAKWQVPALAFLAPWRLEAVRAFGGPVEIPEELREYRV